MPSSLRYWSRVKSPVSDTLSAITFGSDGAYAVGDNGNILWRGMESDDQWYNLFVSGPQGEHEDLYTVATTDDANNVWFAGSSGALGQYRVNRDELINRSAPGGSEEEIHSVAVVGPAGDERVYLGTGSGDILVGTRDRNSMQWRRYETGATAIAALDMDASYGGYAVDTHGGVFRTHDGRNWEWFGLNRVDLSLTDVQRIGDLVWVAGVDGHLFRYDCVCDNWTPLQVGEKDVCALISRSGRCYGIGEEGREFYHTKRGWQNESTTTEEAILDLADGPFEVGVGDSGVIIER